jgi:hypothetical protein
MTVTAGGEEERYRTQMLDPNAVFVFGSNERGIHGAGAARAALLLYGAKRGIGEGPQGRSYALPTMAEIGEPLSLAEIDGRVGAFLAYASAHPDKVFVLTRVGCGIAGYSDSQIAPLFANAPSNVILPSEWEGIS